MNEHNLDSETINHTTKNLALLGRFVREALEEPTRFDAIPESGAVVFMPPDDLDLVQHNIALVPVQRGGDKTITIVEVGVPLAEVANSRINQ